METPNPIPEDEAEIKSVSRRRVISHASLDEIEPVSQLGPKPVGATVNDDDAIDPVCGMHVSRTSPLTHGYAGRLYYFCSASCRTRFAAHPDRYLGDLSEAHQPASPSGAADEVHTCPMHPEVIQTGPGICPKCGMALEPRSPGVAIDDTELRDMTRRFWGALLFTAPLAIWSMAGGSMQAPFIEAILALPVVAWSGAPLLSRAVASLRNRHLNMFSLIGLGVVSAFALSAVNLIAPQLMAGTHPEEPVPLYFESAAVIVTLVLLGQVLELRARRRTGDALRTLLALAPESAVRINLEGNEEEIALDQIAAGDLLRLVPGARVAVDGVVESGTSSVDESMLTGESLPVTKAVGASVHAGTINQAGVLTYRARALGAETLLARIVELVGSAQRSRAPIQRVADQVAAWFVPAVVAAAALAALFWLVLGPPPGVAHAFSVFLAVLIIACPCALGLATPLSIVVGCGQAARAGVLFKDAAALEALARVDTLVLDKTGTLTEGRPRVTGVVPAKDVDRTRLLGLAGALASQSHHPLSQAITQYAADSAAGKATWPALEAFHAEAGLGSRAQVAGSDVTSATGVAVASLGNRAMMERTGIDGRSLDELDCSPIAPGASVVYVALGTELVGRIDCEDRLRADSRATVGALRDAGLRIILASGDREAAVAACAKSLSIEEFHFALSPADKADLIARLEAEGARVAFAGDGINDAAALARATVGVAMGGGADVALHSASVVLLSSDAAGLQYALETARATQRNIRQNLGFAFAYNLAGVPIAAGILYPVTGLLLNPMIASAAMSLSSVSVIANALRLAARSPRSGQGPASRGR